MSVGSVIQDADDTASDRSLDRAITLCAEALEICDALKVSPEIGAKMQEVINALEESARP